MGNKYDLTFDDVMAQIFDSKSWFQGENFKNGYFIQSDDSQIIQLKYFDEEHLGVQDAGPVLLTKGLLTQKFRRVLTQPQIMRKI